MSDAYVGEIRLVPYPHSNPPVGWAFCNGAVLPVSGNEILFTLIGGAYGGNGTTTFALPNLNGRVLVDQGAGMTVPNTTPAGGPPLTVRTVGQAGGAEGVALTEATIPPHDHSFSATTEANSTQTPSGLFYGSNAASTYRRYVNPVPASPTLLALDPTTVQAAGGNAAHLNLMAGLGLRYIICINGLFPVKP
ncbi:phage tail protein [Radicibacter daui]|uniref:phage tail protein n=1 Tax=Radicibacter daui TaxID=3064829 RepID=UPI0040468F02